MSERFSYFAYGSNMFSRRLRMRTPSALVISIGFVEGYRLSFDKPSRRDGSGKCNIRPTNSPADRVYGVLFSILRDEEPALDKAEGLGKGYEKSQFKVTTSDGPCFAAAYVAEEANPLLLPYDLVQGIRRARCDRAQTSGELREASSNNRSGHRSQRRTPARERSHSE